jgi:Flp pilus assembly protein TadB
MNWVRLAAEIVRGAIGTREARPPATQDYIPRDSSSLIDLIQQYRSQVDRGLAALSQEIQDRNERQQHALRIQRRWNYGLLTGLLVLAVLVVVLVLLK